MAERTEADLYVAAQPGIELRLARHIARRVLLVGVPIAAVWWALRGVAGGLSAAGGVAIVAGNYLLTGAVLSRAARVSLGFLHGAALVGFVLRMGLIAGTMLAAAALLPVDRVALGISAVVAYLAALIWEAAVVARDRSEPR